MKLQLDLDRKTVKINENVKLTKLFEVVKKLLPDDQWKEFTLEVNTTIERYYNPIIIEKRVRDWYPYWRDTWYSGASVSGAHDLVARNTDRGGAIVNLEVRS